VPDRITAIDLPGPLPDAFLDVAPLARADDPGWIPEDADALRRRARADHWWFRSGGVARAWVVPGRGRIAAFCHPDARTDGRNAGFFGWWSSTGDPEVDRALLDEAEGFVADLGHEELIGPVEQTSLYGYRLLDQRSDPLGPMVAEPDTPRAMAERLRAEGFEPIHTYNTRLVPSEVLPALNEALVEGVAAATARGYRAVPLTPALLEAHLDALLDILVDAFGENLGYVGPDRATLRRHVRDDLAPTLCPELSTAVLTDDDELAGWMLVYPHYGPLCASSRGFHAVAVADLRFERHIGELRRLVAPARPWAVCRTIAFAAAHRGKGLSPLVVHAANERCMAAYDGWFLAMSRLDNRTQDFYETDPEGRRLYSVYGRAVHNDPERPAP